MCSVLTSISSEMGRLAVGGGGGIQGVGEAMDMNAALTGALNGLQQYLTSRVRVFADLR